MVANHFRWDFYGLSTDTKPDATNPRVTDGSTYYEADTSKLYVWYKDQWYEKTATGGGGGGATGEARLLTTDDYNYPEDNPTSTALWLLPSGLYQKNNDSGTVKISSTKNLNNSEVALVGKQGTYGITIHTLKGASSSTDGYEYGYTTTVTKTGITLFQAWDCATDNTLTSTSEIAPLSAKQGKELKDLIDALDQRITALGG